MKLPVSASIPAVAPSRVYDIIAIAFVSLLLLSNIAATKLIAFNIGDFSLVFDGGAILFPMTYVLGDVLAEVYGFAKARRAILLGFFYSILASVVFLLVAVAPPAAEYENQAAFEAVLGFVPRIVTASLAAYIVGQLLNSWILVFIKNKFGQKHLWARLMGSTVVGELADTLIFCTIAFYGVVSNQVLINYIAVGYIYKVAVEFLILPITYPTIHYVKKLEGVK
ncbi:queuosine precursor transporter [Gleimia sp. 6138-11-ORH1]|uniref:queuosine precursor transporter n=1 Tax=Gleimia sp. 6138-11-ORH1 TaxID=2973937 RepID=UPI002169EF3A|nr:queuosine precursor transporter [Gleimia sp. 6138-11-ORH1]MCS4484550.1 queuosine precursor transporter [Gleimia sp. 6138-11-ORH1]